MDSNLMSCPTCGHSVSNITGACPYCGAMMAEAEQPRQADHKDAGKKAPVAESPPPLPQKQTLAADEISDEVGKIPSAAKERPELDVSQPAADSPASAESLAPATKAPAASTGELISVEDEAAGKPAVDEPELKSAPESGRVNQGLEDNSEVAQPEAVGPESVPDAAADPTPDEKPGIEEPVEGESTAASDNIIPIDRPENQSETVTDNLQSSPEPAAADTFDAKTGESETEGETTVEPIETEATQQEAASPSTPEMSAPREETVEGAETKSVKELPSKEAADLTHDAKGEAASKSLGDTIVLEVENEVEPAAAELPAAAAESAPSESRPEDQSKNRPKADLAKAQALKKQKAALNKAQALKKQKLVLAKAAALRRKKDIQAKAQANKDIQAKAQANIEAAKKKESPAAALPPKSDSGPKANTRMRALLEKYKDRMIGINYDNSADIRKAQLVEANAEYFSVFVKEQNLKYSYPLKAILSLIEGKDGVDVGSAKEPKKFMAVIKVYPLVLF